VTNGVYTTGDQTISGVKTFNGNRVQVSSASNALFEMHVPGTAARAWYVSTDSITRLAVTNGAGSASTVLLSVDGSGNFTALGDITSSSDERLKSDIRTIDNALEKVKQLRGTSYVKDGKNSIGVIAQEVETVFPEVVLDDADGYKSVAYGNLVGVLIEAVKELSARVEQLEGSK